jgi:hypothetical protein
LAWEFERHGVVSGCSAAANHAIRGCGRGRLAKILGLLEPLPVLPQAVRPTAGKGLERAGFSPSGTTLAVADGNDGICLWNIG